jgi:hypothetical protein
VTFGCLPPFRCVVSGALARSRRNQSSGRVVCTVLLHQRGTERFKAQQPSGDMLRTSKFRQPARVRAQLPERRFDAGFQFVTGHHGIHDRAGGSSSLEPRSSRVIGHHQPTSTHGRWDSDSTCSVAWSMRYGSCSSDSASSSRTSGFASWVVIRCNEGHYLSHGRMARDRTVGVSRAWFTRRAHRGCRTREIAHHASYVSRSTTSLAARRRMTLSASK